MRFAAIGLLASLAACFSKPPRPDGVNSDAPPPGDGSLGVFLDGFTHRKHVTVTANAGETLVNFPVGVSVTDPQIAAVAKSNGRDIIATAADGTTLLAHELVAYDTGALELWVRLPELADTGAFYLYYGGSAASPTTAVWDGPVFAGVWHLSEQGTAIDSTAANNALDATGTQLPIPFADGVYGSARLLDGNDKLDGGDPANDSLDFGTSSFSYSLWVQQTQILGLFDTPFAKGGPSNPEPGFCWLLGSAGWAAKVTDNENHTADPDVGIAATFSNRWVHLVAVVDRDAGTFATYADGDARGQKSLATTQVDDLSTTEPIQIGRGTEAPFQGRIDEVRIYKTALSPAWIATEFKNGSDPNFLTFGPEEVEP